MPFDISPGWLSLMGAIAGTSGLAIVEHWLSRSKEEDTLAADMRDELRSDITSLREELHKTTMALDEYRVKYFDLMEKYTLVKLELEKIMGTVCGPEDDKPDK